MALTQKRQNKDEGTRQMEPCIIRAAEKGDIEEALSALKDRPDCINDVDGFGMNALQISIVSMRADFGLFLVNNTDLSVWICLHKDSLGRNAHDLAFIGGSKALKNAVDERIKKEYEAFWEKEDRADAKPMNIKPPTP